MSNFFKDAKKAIDIFTEIRKARKEGHEIEVRQLRQIPLYTGNSFLNTVEGCTLINHEEFIFEQVDEIFSQFSAEEQHRLAFAPKKGEFINRVNFWRENLSPVMTNRDYRKAMITIISWYIKIIKMEKSEEYRRVTGV